MTHANWLKARHLIMASGMLGTRLEGALNGVIVDSTLMARDYLKFQKDGSRTLSVKLFHPRLDFFGESTPASIPNELHEQIIQLADSYRDLECGGHRYYFTLEAGTSKSRTKVEG